MLINLLAAGIKFWQHGLKFGNQACIDFNFSLIMKLSICQVLGKPIYEKDVFGTKY